MSFDIKFSHDWAWVDLSVNRNIGSDVTLLTIGDSWTWGDELGTSCGLASSPCNDTEYRTSKVFGNLLSEKLNCNWVQSALPGAGWGYIIYEFEKLLPQLVTQTEKIIAVLGFSDHGRELSNFDVADTDEFARLYLNGFVGNRPLKELLTDVESAYYQRIDNLLANYPTVQCIAAPVFSSHLTQQPYHTDRQWVDLLFDYTLDPCYSYTSGIWTIDQYLQHHKLHSEQYKEEIYNYWFPAMVKRQAEMDANNLLFDRWHPTEQGHELWANYLYEHINENSYTYLR